MPSAMLVSTVLTLLAAHPAPPIAVANTPPRFQIYDVDRRMRELEHTLARLAGGPDLTHRQADTLLGRLDDIRDRETADRARGGGDLSNADLADINRRLDGVARDIDLRAAPQRGHR